MSKTWSWTYGLLVVGVMTLGIWSSAHRPIAVQTKALSGDKVLADLRYEAERRGLKFMVFCVPKSDGSVDHYDADAAPKGIPSYAAYIEDGGKDWWSTDGPTAVEAAYALYLKLANNVPPDHHAEHRPAPPQSKPACAYNEIYNSETKGRLPCER